jgi:acetolactate synthase I/II/III large subunit
MTGPQPREVGTEALADAVMLEFLRHGVDTIFGIGGTHTLRLLGAIERVPGINFIPARTELGAAYMAIGYARCTGRASIVLTSTGPGALNSIAGLEEANWASLPIVHLTTSIGSAEFAGAVHETPHQEDLLRLANKYFVRISGDSVGRDIGNAVAVAVRAPAGPVTVDVAAGHWADPVLTDGFDAGSFEPEPPLEVEPAILAELVAAIDAAERPLIYVGGGAVRADGGAAALALAEQLGAPILTSHQGKTIATWDHDLYLGTWATVPEVQELAGRADLALVLGSKLSTLGTSGWTLPLPDLTFRIELERGRHPHYPHLRAIQADAAATARALTAKVSSRAPWANGAELRDTVLERAGQEFPEEMAFLEGIDRAEVPTRLFAADMSKAGFWAMKYLRTPPRSVHAFSSYLAMGTALPMAIGMAVATSEPVVAILGDGALQMSMAELATLADLRLPVTLLVIVDNAYGILRDNCALVGGSESTGVDLWNPDLQALSAAYGIEVHSVGAADEVTAVLSTPTTGPRMVLVDQEFSRRW